jgi:hypothetical protein
VNTESELEVWRTAWKKPAPAEAQSVHSFRAQHHRQQRRLRLRYSFSLAFAVILVAYAAIVLHNDFRAEVFAWALVVWITTLGATGFSVWNSSGLWKESASSVCEYADVYEKRSLATLRAMRFGFWFLALQLSIAVPWLTWDFVRHQSSLQRYATGLGLLALISISFAAWFRRSRRSALRELELVGGFRRGLCDERNDPGVEG